MLFRPMLYATVADPAASAPVSINGMLFRAVYSGDEVRGPFPRQNPLGCHFADEQMAEFAIWRAGRWFSATLPEGAYTFRTVPLFAQPGNMTGYRSVPTKPFRIESPDQAGHGNIRAACGEDIPVSELKLDVQAGKNYFVRYRYKGELSPNGLWEISEAEFRAKTKKLKYANLKELFDARLHMMP